MFRPSYCPDSYSQCLLITIRIGPVDRKKSKGNQGNLAKTEFDILCLWTCVVLLSNPVGVCRINMQETGRLNRIKLS
jgi:hypothetical protein